MKFMKPISLSFAISALTLLGAIASADSVDEITLKAGIGSFRINSPNNLLPNGLRQLAKGKITMSFNGTLVIAGLEKGGKVAWDKGIREEYRNDKYSRQVLFGKGTVTIDGTFRAIQWFGSNLNMTWKGIGIAQLFGEVDSKGVAGTYAYKGFPEKFWVSGGQNVLLPFDPTKLPGQMTAPKVKKID